MSASLSVFSGSPVSKDVDTPFLFSSPLSQIGDACSQTYSTRDNWVGKLRLHSLVCPGQQVQLVGAAELHFGLVWRFVEADFHRVRSQPRLVLPAN